MARIALVTGGTRGIGAAISRALTEAGVKVAASYAGNDDAANRFKDDTGIPVLHAESVHNGQNALIPTATPESLRRFLRACAVADPNGLWADDVVSHDGDTLTVTNPADDEPTMTAERSYVPCAYVLDGWQWVDLDTILDTDN